MKSMIEHIAENVLNTPMRELCTGFDRKKWRTKLADLYPILLTPESGKKIGEELQMLVEDVMKRSVSETFERLRVPLDREELDGIIADRLLASLQTPSFIETYRSRISGIIDSFMEREIGLVGHHLPGATRKHLAELAGDLIAETVAARFEDFAGQSGIWDTITESIEGYDNREIERIVRKIANRELKWVTALGGIIGFLIGSIQGWITFFLHF
jgi:uncharacterized membrane protein YheB (UPF0754 family)